MSSLPLVDMRQLEILRKEQEKRKTTVSGASWHEFRIAVSCPPDKQLHMRGGLCYDAPHAADGTSTISRGWTVPSRTADFENESSVGADITFANANYYLGYMLGLQLPDDYNQPDAEDWNFALIGSGTEFANAADAEEDVLDYIENTFQAWDDAMPLCGVILKNNGTTGNGSKILPIDRINRGRSYIWPSDLRPRLLTI